MLECWQENPDLRPSFESLRDRMEDMKKKHEVCNICPFQARGTNTLYTFNFGQVHRCAKECFLFVGNRKISTWRSDRSFANLRAIWQLDGELHCAVAIIYVFFLNLFASKRTRQSIKFSHVERTYYGFLFFVFISK